MNKFLLLFLFCSISTLSYAQEYDKVDGLVVKYPKRFKSVDKLAQRIETDFSNDFEKVRAIYTWITINVGYDMKEFGRYNFAYSSNEDRIAKQKIYQDKLSKHVITRGKAVCQGYAILFIEVCTRLGIKSEFISGDGKGYIRDIGRKFISDHAWNTVEIDNKTYLIDATWGAKKERTQGKLTVEYMYFLQAPQEFIKGHYPDNYVNSLLEEEIPKQDYLNGPMFFSDNYQLISPQSGIINRRGLKDLSFEFKTPSPLSVDVYYTVGSKTFKVENATYANNTLQFVIPAKQIKRTKELVLFFGQETVVGFKVK